MSKSLYLGLLLATAIILIVATFMNGHAYTLLLRASLFTLGSAIVFRLGERHKS